MNHKMENYVETVCNCIKWKNYRYSIKMEFENHICDSVNAYIGQGVSEEEATDLALQDMGDPHIIGEQLNEVYQPKCNKMLVLTVALPIIVFSLCEYFALLEISGDDFYLIKVLVRILAGGFGGFWLFQNDWGGEGKLNWFALNSYMGIIAVCTILHFFFFPGKMDMINGMFLLLPHLCCCCIDRVKDKKIVGLLIGKKISVKYLIILKKYDKISSTCTRRCKDAGSENDITGSIYYNLHSVGYISIDAGRKIGGIRRDQRRGGDLLGKEQGTFHGRNSGEDHEVSGRRLHCFSGYSESQCILKKGTKALLQKSRAFFAL